MKDFFGPGLSEFFEEGVTGGGTAPGGETGDIGGCFDGSSRGEVGVRGGSGRGGCEGEEDGEEEGGGVLHYD